MNLRTSQGAAGVLRLSLKTLERFRYEGMRPKYLKLGRRVVYRQGDLETWAAQDERHSTSEVAR